MRIVVVIDQLDSENDAPSHSKGAAVWASRYVEMLRARGHEVRVVSTGDEAPDKYVVKTKIYPIIADIVADNGFVFARMDEAVVRRAFVGADIIHFMFPFKLSYTTLKIAQEMDIPIFSAFHCQPENVTYNLGFKHFPIVATYIYGRYNRMFYKHFNHIHCPTIPITYLSFHSAGFSTFIGQKAESTPLDHIHCPTQFIADQLVKHNYKGKLHVISNGVDSAFCPIKVEKPAEWKDKYVIGMVGRLAAEKRQDLIIQAVAMSKYKDKIQLVFCGKGPKEKKYKKLVKKLGVSAKFGFYRKDDLLQLINTFDLYVHSSEIEIEAVACWEALACGKVPVIANSPNSATRFFALDNRSLFRNKDAADLCAKIEYWMENPKEKMAMSKEYITAARNNTLSKSIDRIEQVYEQVIAEHEKSQQRVS